MSNVEALLKACRVGDKDSVKEVLSQNPGLVNSSDSKLGWTGLYCSVMCGHAEIVKYLISNLADVNVQNRMGETPLHQAVECRNLKIAKMLLKNKADPNIQQNDGETPLHMAILQVNYKAVCLLLKYSASPNIPNYLYGKTPTHYAVECGNSRIYSEIVNNGADLQMKDKQGYSAESLMKNAEVSNKDILSITQQLSPGLTRCNSETSTLQEKRSIDSKLKQIQVMHQMIRETVRTSVDTTKRAELSQSSAGESEEGRAIKTAPTDLNPELYNWLKSIRLTSEYETLVTSGYDDLAQMVKQMKSNIPLNERCLIKIGMKKIGHRRRLLASLSSLASRSEDPGFLTSLQCCVALASGFMRTNYQALDHWLQDLNLPGLEKVLHEAGFEEVEDLMVLDGTPWALDDGTLCGLGIEKPGYRHRILAKIKENGDTRKSSELILDKTSNSSACTLCYIM
jgi:ankyrin repeat protein